MLFKGLSKKLYRKLYALFEPERPGKAHKDYGKTLKIC